MQVAMQYEDLCQLEGLVTKISGLQWEHNLPGRLSSDGLSIYSSLLWYLRGPCGLKAYVIPVLWLQDGWETEER